MFQNTFLDTAYADDSTFFLKDKNSTKELLNTINYISSFTCLKPILSTYEEAGIGTLKGVKVLICGIKCIDLTKEAIKILGVLFSYDKYLQFENNFRRTILNIERILKMWRQRDLTLEGKVILLGLKSCMINVFTNGISLIKNTFREYFIFHSDLDFNVSLNLRPEFYINIFHSWKNTFSFLSLLSLTVSDLSFCVLIKILKSITNWLSLSPIKITPQKAVPY